MAKLTNRSKVHYLAFEGGGGKGITYLGAIHALEDQQILPTSRQQIKGISGASAGAITALLVALGLSFSDLEKFLEDEGKNFKTFYDGPDNREYRQVNSNNVPGRKKDKEPEGATSFNIIRAVSTIADLDPIDMFIKLLAPDNYQEILDSIMGNSANWKVDYIYNLLFDRGIFPGFKVRDFFTRIIADQLQKQERFQAEMKKIESERGGIKKNWGLINFQDFYRVTGVDFVVSGTNITRQQPRYFSQADTPGFLVAEAVGISMSIPFVFKPVWVDKLKGHEDYEGYWVDGGVLNNLPIHTFDDVDAKGKRRVRKKPKVLPLNEHILGLRLTEGYDPKDQEPGAQLARIIAEAEKANSSVLGDFLASIVGTYMYPSEEGQIRTPSERDQTIVLYTQELSLLEFMPSKDKSQKPIEKAYSAVYKNFGNLPPEWA